MLHIQRPMHLHTSRINSERCFCATRHLRVYGCAQKDEINMALLSGDIQTKKHMSDRHLLTLDYKTLKHDECWCLKACILSSTRTQCKPLSVSECLFASCRGTALWPLSRFLAVTHHSPFPLVPWERLPLPLLWQSQWPDCSLCVLPVRTISTYRWATFYEATGLDFNHLCKHSRCQLTKFSVC